MSRAVELELKLFVCDGCGRAFTHVLFVGDTDMATAGLCAASSRDTLDAAIIETTAEEWTELATRRGTLVERRLSQILGRSDFVVLQSRYEDTAPPEIERMSYQEFSAAWTPPRHWRTSPCCPGAEAHEEETLTRSQLATRGGAVIAVGDLSVTEPS